MLVVGVPIFPASPLFEKKLISPDKLGSPAYSPSWLQLPSRGGPYLRKWSQLFSPHTGANKF